MGSYILKRVLNMIPILFGITIFIFLIFKAAPGDPISSSIERRLTVEQRTQLKEQAGFNRPKLEQYGIWLSKAVRGDLGESYYFKQPVGSVIRSYIWNSFYLSAFSFLFSVMLSIPLGVISATKQYSKFDSSFTTLSLVGISMPSFFFGLLLIKLFSVDLRLFPVSGMHTPGSNLTGFAGFTDFAWHMALPLAVLTLSSVAGLMRFTRSSMLEVIRQDYIRAARARGLGEKVVIYRHALKNALIPVITIFGMSLAGLFSGAVLTETIFAWPGIGPIQLLAVNNRDYNLLMGYSLIIAVLTLLGNFLADICYALVDPRIRFK